MCVFKFSTQHVWINNRHQCDFCPNIASPLPGTKHALKKNKLVHIADHVNSGLCLSQEWQDCAYLIVLISGLCTIEVLALSQEWLGLWHSCQQVWHYLRSRTTSLMPLSNPHVCTSAPCLGMQVDSHLVQKLLANKCFPQGRSLRGCVLRLYLVTEWARLIWMAWAQSQAVSLPVSWVLGETLLLRMDRTLLASFFQKVDGGIQFLRNVFVVYPNNRTEGSCRWKHTVSKQIIRYSKTMTDC